MDQNHMILRASLSLQAIFQAFDHKVIISLAAREDRRNRVSRNLSSLGIAMADYGVEWIDGSTFDDAAGFPGKGVRGCFESHLRALRCCAAADRPMLIMEDDMDLNVRSLSQFDPTAITMAIQSDWDIIYFGHLTPGGSGAGANFQSYTGDTIGGHFYAVSPSFARHMAAFMETCKDRKPGDPAGGPMYRDAAFNFQRASCSKIQTLIAIPPLAGQFSSRSDLALRPRFYDRIPYLRGAAELARRWKARSVA